MEDNEVDVKYKGIGITWRDKVWVSCFIYHHPQPPRLGLQASLYRILPWLRPSRKGSNTALYSDAHTDLCQCLASLSKKLQR